MVGRPLSVLTLAGSAVVAASLVGVADAVSQGAQQALTADDASQHPAPPSWSEAADAGAPAGAGATASSALWGRLVRREAATAEEEEEEASEREAAQDLARRHVVDAARVEPRQVGNGGPRQEITETDGGVDGRPAYIEASATAATASASSPSHVGRREEMLREPAGTMDSEGPPLSGEPSSATSSEAASSSLPHGWQVAKDPTSGKQYYYNRDLGLSQWEVPKAEAEGLDDTIAQRSHRNNGTSGDGTTPAPLEVSEATSEPEKVEVSSSERLKLMEHTSDCMLHDNPETCMKKFGTFGVKRLRTQTWEEITNRNWQRPSWMANPKVQARNLLDVTFPGTHASASFAFKPGMPATSGTFSVDGIQKQHLDIEQQLELGIRAFDLEICSDFENDNKLWVCNQLLLVPLSEVLDEMEVFLQRQTSEVIVVRAKIGEARHTAALENVDPRYSEFLRKEALSPNSLPGQSVHDVFLDHLGELILIYGVLERLPGKDTWENPKISSLVGLNARVIYFWETQQVLCTSVKACMITPMWDATAFNRVRANQLIFEPLPMGSRPKREGRKSAEPLCSASSAQVTENSQPSYLVENIKKWSLAIPGELPKMLPKCFPTGAKAPQKHGAPVMFWAEVAVSSHVNKVNFKELRSGFLCGVGADLKKNDTMKCKNFYSPFECFVSREACFQKLLPMMDANCKEGDGMLSPGAKCCGPYFNFKKDGEVAGACSCPVANSPAAKSECALGTAVPDVKVYELVAEGQEDSPQQSANSSMATALGENFTIMSIAEHVNYLLLSWYMKENATAMFTAPNVVLVDFVHPVLVHRIVESMQGSTECGCAVLCNETGSCNAKSRLRRSEESENGGDKEEESVEERIEGVCQSEEEAERDLEFTLEDKEKAAAFTCLVLIMCCMVGIVASMCKASPKAEGEEEEEEEGAQKEAAGGEAAEDTAAQAESPRRLSMRSNRAPVFSGTGELPASAPAPAAEAAGEGGESAVQRQATEEDEGY